MKVTLTGFGLVAGIILCLVPVDMWAAEPQLATFTPSEVTRGGSFKIDIVPPPAAADFATASVKLYREGKEAALKVAFPFATVPDDPALLAVGTYQVIVQVGTITRSGTLRIRPPGTAEIKLDAFDPNNTSTTQTIFVAPGDAKSAAGKTEPPKALLTVPLTIKGSGFLPNTPDDNTIWINGVKQNVDWKSGSDYGAACDPGSETENGGIRWGIHGHVVSSEEIDLCHVPVSSDGAMLVKAGYGDLPRDGQRFNVYWIGTAKAGLISFVCALLCAGLIFWLLSLGKGTYQIAGENYKLRLLFLDPETDTYSLSKFQFYLWTFAALFTYTYLYIGKVFVQHGSWPDIPGTLPGIIGIGAGTAVGSQVVTAANGSKGAGPEKPGFLDFLTSGGVVAADRVQMFLWTLFGVAAFCIGVLRKAPGTITGIDPVPDNMMYMMGLSAAGYLGGKMARKPGPVITELTVTPGQSDQALAAAATAAVDLPDFGQASLVAASNLNSLAKVANPNAQKAIDAFSSAIKSAASIHTTSDVASLISGLSTQLRDCEDGALKAADDFSASPAKATSQDAAAAQQAAAFLQEFCADVTQAIAASAIPAMAATGSLGSVARVIELRGSNLSPDGNFEIGRADLPFRMLINEDGDNAPDVVARQDGGNFASILRFTIDPARLDSTDLAQYQAWFGADAAWVASLINPDGQRADQSFSLPPATVKPQPDPKPKQAG